MKLGEAIECGYKKCSGKWGKGLVYNPEAGTYCAIGLAILGSLGDRPQDPPHGYYSIFRMLFPVDDEEVASINDSSDSYEEMLARLKNRGLAEIEGN